MKKIIRYVHHGIIVAVYKRLKGKHREHCLCWDCDKFFPDDREKNCPIANTLYRLNILAGITTPVWECEEYYKGK